MSREKGVMLVAKDVRSCNCKTGSETPSDCARHTDPWVSLQYTDSIKLAPAPPTAWQLASKNCCSRGRAGSTAVSSIVKSKHSKPAGYLSVPTRATNSRLAAFTEPKEMSNSTISCEITNSQVIHCRVTRQCTHWQKHAGVMCACVHLWLCMCLILWQHEANGW